MHSQILKLLFLGLSVLLASLFPARPAMACQSYTLFEIADAIKASRDAPSEVKWRSCMWGGAAIAESSGNTCSHNSNNFGVLQLSRQNIEHLGLSPLEYMSQSLQDQIDGWALAGAAENDASEGYSLINNDISRSRQFGQTMEGSLAACSQFGPCICNNDVDLLHDGKPLPNRGAFTAIRCTNASCNSCTANQDQNGETIVSWGLTIQRNIISAECADREEARAAVGPYTPRPASEPAAP
jgi:hypothetical protein